MNYFVWNDRTTIDLGIRIESPAPIQRGEERVTKVTVPGRIGQLTLAEGIHVYDPYLQTQHVFVPTHRVSETLRWLSGEGRITFSSEPERVQEARVIHDFNLSKLSKNLEWWEGDVSFLCQPFKKRRVPAIVTLDSCSMLINGGDIEETPIITVYGTGDCELTIADKTLVIPSVTDGAVIDCEIMEVFDLNGNYKTGISGEYPHPPRGAYTVELTEGFSAAVQRGERFL